MRTSLQLAMAVAISAAPGAHAQLSAPPIPSALPNVSSISAGNAAGVLQYCVKNNLVSSTSADSVLGGLTSKPDVTKSPDFMAGQAGNILSGGGKSFSVGKAPSYLQSQACDMVLKQAKHLP